LSANAATPPRFASASLLATRKNKVSRQNIARLFSPTEPAYRDERARDERKSPHATRGHQSDARFSPITASNPRARIPNLIQTLD
jgi:hypothetical protein